MNQPDPNIHVGPGATLQSRYLVQAPLGMGSQATVWRCLDTITDTPVAIKHAVDPVEWPNARREYVLLRLLDLPGVVSILDEWVDPGGWFVVMRLLDGSPFPEAADWPRVRTLMRSVLSTLAAMHGRGIVHADLKADNMMVSGDTVTLIDLGFAMDGHAATDLSGCSLATAAPELWMGERASPASDVFALARVAVNALGARPPGHPDLRTGHRGLIAAVASLDVPPDDRAMLTRMLAWEASARPSSSSLVAWLGEDIGRELTIKARHRFDHTPEDMHALLGAGTVSLQWLLDAGVGKVEGDAVYFTREEVSRLELALAPRSDDPDAPPLRALDAGDVHTVLAWCLDAVARPELLRWSLPLARWSVGHTQAIGSERHLDALTLFTSLAVHSEQAQAMHDAALTVDRVAVCPVGAQCRSLLRAAIDVRVRGRMDVEFVTRTVASGPLHPTLEPVLTLVEVWHMRSDLGRLRGWLEQQLQVLQNSKRHGRLLTWASVVAYQQQDYAGGLDFIKRKADEGHPSTMSDRFNEAELLLESSEHERVVDIAGVLRAQACSLRMTTAEARATVLERSARYRLACLRAPDVSLVDEVASFSTIAASVVALNEAAIAFRYGGRGAAELAERALRYARTCGNRELTALSDALAAAILGDVRRALAVMTGLADGAVGSLVVQTIGLCRLAGVAVDESDQRRRIQSEETSWCIRREVLSIWESLGATGIALPQSGEVPTSGSS